MTLAPDPGALIFTHIHSPRTMPKADIHPKWYPEAKVFCNGEQVMTVGSTKPELSVDVWSGNHPFYTGTQKIIDTEGRVERFLRKYGMSDEPDETTTEGRSPRKVSNASLETVRVANL